ncbi:unnamed protein product [Colias eurytheme]|nr:unnamed protein product [Colias eurytheme]
MSLGQLNQSPIKDQGMMDVVLIGCRKPDLDFTTSEKIALIPLEIDAETIANERFVNEKKVDISAAPSGNRFSARVLRVENDGAAENASDRTD